MRRGRPDRRAPNPRQPPLRLYAFLAALDGPPEGPWLATFECVRAEWLEDLLGPYGALHARNYGIERLRQVMAGGTYEAAWEQSIANRVVLRRAYEAYSEELARPGGPWRLCVYRVVLHEDDLPNSFGDTLTPGLWYALEVATQQQGDGALAIEDPATGQLEEETHHPFVRLSALARTSGPPLFVIGPTYHSQATLRALHFMRAEE